MIQFKSRFLRPAEAILCLVARNIGGTLGMTLVFDLKTTIDTVTHSEVIKSESPCYEMQDIGIKVTNPFESTGEFRVILVESADNESPINLLTNSLENSGAPSSNHSSFRKGAIGGGPDLKNVKARTDHGQKKDNLNESSVDEDSGHYVPNDPEILKS